MSKKTTPLSEVRFNQAVNACGILEAVFKHDMKPGMRITDLGHCVAIERPEFQTKLVYPAVLVSAITLEAVDTQQVEKMSAKEQSQVTRAKAAVANSAKKKE